MAAIGRSRQRFSRAFARRFRKVQVPTWCAELVTQRGEKFVFEAALPLGLVALNSDVLSPADGETVAAGPVEVRGYAFAGGERHVARVDVSVAAEENQCLVG